MPSRYQTTPLNFAVGAGKNKSLTANPTNLINMFLERQSSSSNAPVVAKGFAGLKEYGEPSDIAFSEAGDNGIHRMANEIVYRVVQGRLYRVLKGGVHEFINTIEDNSVFENPIKGLINFADNKIWIIMVYRSAIDGVYKLKGYNTVTEQLVFIIDNESPIKFAESVTYLNNQFIYSVGNEFYVNVGDTPFDVNTLDKGQAESYADDLIRAYVFKQGLYLFGKRTIETWFNTGTGFPPFERVTGQILNVGLEAKFSIANNDNFFYFLADDNAIYASNGSQADKISNNSIVTQIEKMEDKSDAVGFTFSFSNHNFYAITFPSAGKTFCFNESIGSDLGWFELSSSAFFERDRNYYNIYKAFSAVDAYGTILMPAIDSNKLYELDIDTYTNGDEIMRREMTLPTLNGTSLGQLGARIKGKRLEFITEKGVGNISGDGIDPQMHVELSFDEGKTFGNASWVKLGRLGQTNFRSICNFHKYFYSMQIRVKCSDPVFLAISGIAVDLQIGGN
jgi:hypothetical protein